MLIIIIIIIKSFKKYLKQCETKDHILELWQQQGMKMSQKEDFDEKKICKMESVMRWGSQAAHGKHKLCITTALAMLVSL